MEPAKLRDWLGDEHVLRAPPDMVTAMTKSVGVADAIAEEMRSLPYEVLEHLEAGKDPGLKAQPRAGLKRLRTKLPRRTVSAFERWTKSHNWEDFVALGRRIGVRDVTAFAGWCQAIRKGYGRRRPG